MIVTKKVPLAALLLLSPPFLRHEGSGLVEAKKEKREARQSPPNESFESILKKHGVKPPQKTKKIKSAGKPKTSDASIEVEGSPRIINGDDAPMGNFTFYAKGLTSLGNWAGCGGSEYLTMSITVGVDSRFTTFFSHLPSKSHLNYLSTYDSARDS